MDPSSVTKLLEQGTPEALDRVFPIVYEELVGVARMQRRGWRGELTLNTTALVHEAYLKLVGAGSSAQNRAHFLAVAAKAMRHILVNYAERKSAIKRGGDFSRVDFESLSARVADVPVEMTEEHALTILDLDRALTKLALEREELSRVVECRIFGQMSREETARALDISEATVKRRSRLAESWLFREMSEERQ